MSRFKMLCLLALVPCVLALPTPGYKQEKLLLKSVDLDHLAAAFEAEELEIGHISRLDDSSLRSLGVTTMGGRQRLRDAALVWSGAEEEEGGGGGEEDGGGAGAEEEGGGEEEGAGAEEDGAGGREEDDAAENQIIFTTNTLKTGRTTHHFLQGFYRFDRKYVKKSGRAYFTCSVRECKARMAANYTLKQTQNTEEPVPDLSTLPASHQHTLPDGTIHPIQVQTTPHYTTPYHNTRHTTTFHRWG